MNTLFFCFVLTFFTAHVYLHAQVITTDTRRYIEVTGSAEMSLKPDEIELEIMITEYEDKRGNIVSMQDVETELRTTLARNNISTQTLSLKGLSLLNWWYWWYDRNNKIHTKTVYIKLSSSTNFMQLVQDLNKEWVKSIAIEKSSNKDLQQHRKDVKIQALKAAKEKALYLLESVGEQLGGVLSIEELPEQGDNPYSWFGRGTASLASNISMGSSANESDAIKNVAEIKLRYEVKVKFALK